MKRIIALIDFSEVTPHLTGLAGDMARAMNSKLLLLHVAMPDADYVGDKEREDVSRNGIARELRGGHRAMEVLEADLKRRGVDVLALMVRGDSVRGNPCGKILEELDRLSPDLVVLGSHGHGRMYQLLIGSVSDAVIRKANCPVLVVPSRAARPAEKCERVAPEIAQ